MTILSKKQRKLLKKLLKSPITDADKIHENLYIYAYLREVGYITVEVDKHYSELPNGFTGVASAVKSISISEKGRAYLYECRITTFGFIIPTVISIASLAVSIFALFLS